MKYLGLVLVFAATALAREVRLRDGIVPKKLGAIQLEENLLPQISWEHIREILMTKGELRDGFIQADVTKYALEVVGNIQRFIIEQGLDPLELSEEDFDLFPTGTLNLTNGWLSQLSTINISAEVIAKYSATTKVLELTLPLAFESLFLAFDYATKITIISIDGTIDGTVSDISLDLHMGFNFSSYYAFVDKADVKDTGKIDIEFTGLGLLDWIIDLMSDVVTTLFHGIILSVVDLVIQNPVDSVVGAINELIDELLKRNQTDLLTY